MIRLSRIADYGIVVLSEFARRPDAVRSAQEMAAATRVPGPVTSKILKALARGGLLTSQRGVKGGYALARAPERITVAQIIAVLDGPIALTACTEDGAGHCTIEAFCPTRAHWQRINEAIHDALDGVTLADMRAGGPPLKRDVAVNAA